MRAKRLPTKDAASPNPPDNLLVVTHMMKPLTTKKMSTPTGAFTNSEWKP